MGRAKVRKTLVAHHEAAHAVVAFYLRVNDIGAVADALLERHMLDGAEVQAAITARYNTRSAEATTQAVLA